MGTNKQVPLKLLRPGVVLSSPVIDPSAPNVKLLGSGVTLTETFLSALRRRGIAFVALADADVAVLSAFTPSGRRTKVPPPHQYSKSNESNTYTQEMDELIGPAEFGDRIQNVPAASAGPFRNFIQLPDDVRYADGLPEQWARQTNEEIERISQFIDDTVDRRQASVQPLKDSCQMILNMISEDQDALACLCSTPHHTGYPSRHGIYVAGIAMATGTQMGLDQSKLIDLGLGCLLHDAGMKSIGLPIFETKQTLSRAQLNRLANHPVRSVEIAGEFGDDISVNAKLVAYQMHERCDGSGYPRGWTSTQIHPLAKIAAVADSYVGMLSQRTHRLAIQGYYAISRLLDELKQGKLDVSSVRALLNVVSLYPLGSYVELNNDCIGRVIRSGGERFVQPTIEMWHQDHQDRSPVVVSLRQEPKIQIQRSIPADQVSPRRAA